MVRQRRLLVLGARLAQIPIYREARARGLFVIGADPDAAAPGLALADERIICDLRDAAALLAQARRFEIDGALTYAADYPMPALGQLCASLGLAGPDPATTHRATHKAAMREALARAGVPCPRYHHVHTLDSAADAASSLGGDIIVKPAFSSGGRGVMRLAAAAAGLLPPAFAHAQSFCLPGEGVMVEEFVEGDEFSVEMLSRAGEVHVLAVTDKFTSGPPHYVELGHQQPSRLSSADRAAVEATAVMTVRALGIEGSAAHAELRLGRDGPVVMECAARAGGGFITSHLVPLSTGFNMVSACISVALNEAPDLQPAPHHRGAAICFVTVPPGLLGAIEGIEEARSLPGIVDVQLYVEPGHRIGVLRDATARCGHVIAVGDDPAGAMRRAEAGRERLRLAVAG